MARDYYEDARALVRDLRTAAAAHEAGAARIEETIAAGFTATEILMGIRFHIRELLGDETVPLSNSLKDAAVELAGAIDEALGT